MGLAATASGGGCLAAARGNSQTKTPTTSLPNVDALQFSRIGRPNVYDLSYAWRHHDRRWQLDLALSKERYHSAISASRSIPRCFSDAVSSDLCNHVATKLSRHLDSEGVKSPVERLRVATAFVRNFEYRRDSEDTGEREYPKYVEETLTECAGDCEDFAILLAGILSSPSFDHDVELLAFSGHIGLGVLPSSVAENVSPLLTVGSREFLYVDATIDVSLGRVPRKYRDPGVIARYDGTWRIVDPVGLTEHAISSISQGMGSDLGNYV